MFPTPLGPILGLNINQCGDKLPGGACFYSDTSQVPNLGCLYITYALGTCMMKVSSVYDVSRLRVTHVYMTGRIHGSCQHPIFYTAILLAIRGTVYNRSHSLHPASYIHYVVAAKLLVHSRPDPVNAAANGGAERVSARKSMRQLIHQRKLNIIEQYKRDVRRRPGCGYIGG